MPTLEDYPENCRQSIQTISEKLKTSFETSYAMILLNACLMDLYPSDKKVVETILSDVLCG